MSWAALKGQFGQEYADTKNFKRKFMGALQKATGAYKEARIETISGGLKLLPSPPPVQRKQVMVAAPIPDARSVARTGRIAAAPDVAEILALLPEEALRRAKALMPGVKIEDLARDFVIARRLRAPHRASELEEAFVKHVKARLFGRAEDGGSPVEMAPEAAAGEIALRAATIEEARRIAPQWNIADLVRRWRAWSKNAGGEVKFPDAAFLGWLRSFIKQR